MKSARAKKLAAAGLRKEIEIDWQEVARLASRPEYGNLEEVKELAHETAEALGKRSPYDPDEGRDQL